MISLKIQLHLGVAVRTWTQNLKSGDFTVTVELHIISSQERTSSSGDIKDMKKGMAPLESLTRIPRSTKKKPSAQGTRRQRDDTYEYQGD